MEEIENWIYKGIVESAKMPLELMLSFYYDDQEPWDYRDDSLIDPSIWKACLQKMWTEGLIKFFWGMEFISDDYTDETLRFLVARVKPTTAREAVEHIERNNI